MTTKEIADKLVAACKQGDFFGPYQTLYSPDIVSVEAGAPPGQSREAKGMDAIRAKGDWWTANHEMHSASVEGPLVAGEHFSVAFKMEITFKPENRRFTMEEIAVYKVADGKIVREEFFYSM